jgi:hypothetical protein
MNWTVWKAVVVAWSRHCPGICLEDSHKENSFTIYSFSPSIFNEHIPITKQERTVFNSRDGIRLSPLRTPGTSKPIILAPDDRWAWSSQWNNKFAGETEVVRELLLRLSLKWQKLNIKCPYEISYRVIWRIFKNTDYVKKKKWEADCILQCKLHCWKHTEVAGEHMKAWGRRQDSYSNIAPKGIKV